MHVGILHPYHHGSPSLTRLQDIEICVPQLASQCGGAGTELLSSLSKPFPQGPPTCTVNTKRTVLGSWDVSHPQTPITLLGDEGIAALRNQRSLNPRPIPEEQFTATRYSVTSQSKESNPFQYRLFRHLSNTSAYSFSAQQTICIRIRLEQLVDGMNIDEGMVPEKPFRQGTSAIPLGAREQQGARD